MNLILLVGDFYQTFFCQAFEAFNCLILFQQSYFLENSSKKCQFQKQNLRFFYKILC